MDNEFNPEFSLYHTTVFGCGGCGVNTIKRLMPLYLGRTNLVAIDTSATNLRRLDLARADVDELDSTIVVRLDGCEGAGKDRTVLRADIDRVVKADNRISQHFSDLNIIVFSATGGSGSVIGPRLIQRALEEGKCAIALVVTDATCHLDLVNFNSTMEDLNLVGEMPCGVPIIMYSNNEFGRKKTDAALHHDIARLATMFSGVEVDELDKTDCDTFFRNCTGLCTLELLGGDRVYGCTNTLKSLDDDQGLTPVDPGTEFPWRFSYTDVRTKDIRARLTICEHGECPHIPCRTAFIGIADPEFNQTQEYFVRDMPTVIIYESLKTNAKDAMDAKLADFERL